MSNDGLESLFRIFRLRPFLLPGLALPCYILALDKLPFTVPDSPYRRCDPAPRLNLRAERSKVKNLSRDGGSTSRSVRRSSPWHYARIGFVRWAVADAAVLEKHDKWEGQLARRVRELQRPEATRPSSLQPSPDARSTASFPYRPFFSNRTNRAEHSDGNESTERMSLSCSPVGKHSTAAQSQRSVGMGRRTSGTLVPSSQMSRDRC